MLKKLLLTMCLVLGLSACAASDKTISEDSPEHLYTQAKKLFDEKEYEKSALLFDEVERQPPVFRLGGQIANHDGLCLLSGEYV